MGATGTVGTTRFKERAAIKVLRMLLVLCVERRSASRFSFSGLLRIVMRERDWRTDEEESGCASRFSLSRSLTIVMWRSERDWRTGDDMGVFVIEDGFIRMPHVHGETGESEEGRCIGDKGLRVTSS